MPHFPRTVSRLLNRNNKAGSDPVQRSEVPQPAPIVTVPQPVASEETVRGWWHTEIYNLQDVSQYLITGYHPNIESRVDTLKDVTAKYLRAQTGVIIVGSPQCDVQLGNLLGEHARFGGQTWDVAVLSCISSLSPSAGSSYLAGFIEQEPGRYLRFLLLAERLCPGIVPHDVRQIAESLERLLRNADPRIFPDFQRLVERLSSSRRLSYELIPLSFTQRALEQCKLRHRSEEYVWHLINATQLSTLFRLVSWFATHLAVPNSTGLHIILDQHCPCWRWLVIWRPNLDRISRWELGGLSEKQKEALKHFYRLDGPDNIYQQHDTFKKAEPECYALIRLHCQTQQTLDRVLNILYIAHRLGSGAVDLFIHLCVQNAPTEDGLSTLEDAIRDGNAEKCNTIHALMVSLTVPRNQNNRNLGGEIDSLIEVLSKVCTADVPRSMHSHLDTLIQHLVEVMGRAQEAFSTQLLKGTADWMGMKIRDLGDAILKAPSIQASLPAPFLSNVHQFPPCDALNAIFECLEGGNYGSTEVESPLKRYLAATLGGQGGEQSFTDPVALASVQEEIRFWQGRPDTGRRDLANIVGSLKRLRYPRYTSWLTVMLYEDDLCVREVTDILKNPAKERVLEYANYLSRRRAKNQLMHKSWLLLFATLMEDQGSDFLPNLASRLPFEKWAELMKHVQSLAQTVRSELPQFGVGLTQQQLTWWDSLASNKDSVQFLLKHGNQSRGTRLMWLYFPSASSMDSLTKLMDTLRSEGGHVSLFKRIASFLDPSRNLDLVCDSMEAVRHLSSFGLTVCTRIFSYETQVQYGKWHEQSLGIQLTAWVQSRRLSSEDKRALESIKTLLPYQLDRASPTSSAYSALKAQLRRDYNALVDRTHALEVLRRKLHVAQPARLASALSSAGIEATPHRGRSDIGEIPLELADAIEVVGEKEYEMCFILTTVGDLQRKSKGIPSGARMLIIRIRLGSSPAFCIHYSPHHEQNGTHTMCQVPSGTLVPTTPVCGTPPSLFTYYLQRWLYRTLTPDNQSRRPSFFSSAGFSRRGFSQSRQDASLQGIHTGITNLINKAARTCLVCGAGLQSALWKPATCGRVCSVSLRTAPLEVRLHNLLIDPDAVDLLLTSIYAGAHDANITTFLPNCPVPIAQLQTVINSFPSLATLQTATDLRLAIRGSDQYGSLREALLSYVCLRFRGFILSAPDRSKIPSMGTNVKQFLLVNSNQEREQMFATNYTPAASSAVVFHGTHVQRLFPILCDGLRVANGGLRINGAMYGPGVYCGDAPSLSLSYAGPTGQSWTNSACSNLKVLLGCELAPATATTHTNTHVITDESRLLVRYVFLLPLNWTAPPKHHIEPAMTTVYTMLRSGLQS